MRRLAAVLGLSAILTLFTPSPAVADEGCVVDILGIKVCGKLLTPLPTVTVTVKPNPLPAQTVTLPPLSGPTRTVTVPGPTETVTVQPNSTKPSDGPTRTVTATSSPTPNAGQPAPSRATVRPSPELGTGGTVHDVRTKTETVVRTVLATALAILVLIAIGLLLTFLGYMLGQRDAKNKENDFLEGLLDYAKIRKRP